MKAAKINPTMQELEMYQEQLENWVYNIQCVAATDKGLRCKNAATSPSSFCKIHKTSANRYPGAKTSNYSKNYKYKPKLTLEEYTMIMRDIDEKPRRAKKKAAKKSSPKKRSL